MIVASIPGLTSPPKDGVMKEMKARVLFALAVSLAIPTLVLAGETRTIQKNPFVEGRYDIFEGGKRVGTVRENPFVKGRYDLYDRSERKTGELRPDPFVPDRWRLEER